MPKDAMTEVFKGLYWHLKLWLQSVNEALHITTPPHTVVTILDLLDTVGKKYLVSTDPVSSPTKKDERSVILGTLQQQETEN